MLENLRLDNSSAYASIVQEFALNNTHNPSLPLTNVYNADSSLAEVSNRLSVTSSSWCDTAGNASCLNQSKLNTDNIRQAANTEFDNDINVRNYSYGNYYNWYSATAGNGTTGDIDNNVSVNGDICPSNWRLPIGGGIPNSEYSGEEPYPHGDNSDDSDFYALSKSIVGVNIIDGIDNNLSNSSPYNNSKYNNEINLFKSYPYNFVLSGFLYIDLYNATSQNSLASKGLYWSSTAWSGDNAYSLDIRVDSKEVYPGTAFNGKYHGFTVRCLAGA